MPALPEGVGVSTFSLLQPLSRPVAWTVGRSHSPMLTFRGLNFLYWCGTIRCSRSLFRDLNARTRGTARLPLRPAALHT